MKNLIQFVRDKLHRQVHQPMEEMTRFQKALRYGYDLARFCAEQLGQDRALDMAAALTYRTIFSLVPTIILALVVFRAFVSFDEAQRFLEVNVYNNLLALDALEVAARDNTIEVELENPDEPSPLEKLTGSDEPVAASDEQVQKTEKAAKQTVKDMVNGFIRRGYDTQLGGIGGVGLLLLVWAALALAVTLEQCFNRIFRAPTGRTWVGRILLYWTVLTLGPVMMSMSLFLTGKIYAQAEELPVIGTLIDAMGSVGALVTSFLLLMMLYKLMPNAKVQLRPAAIGAAVAALLWELGKVGFKSYAGIFGVSSIYGSLGLLPLFLFWMYVTWLIVLFGLELTYVLQTMEVRKLAQQQKERQHDERDLITDSRYLLPIMSAIGGAFENGRALDADDIARQLRLPSSVAANFCRRLEHAGLIHGLDAGGYALARPAERIAITDLLKLARSLAHLEERKDSDTPGWALLAELNAAETEASTGLTLADALRKSAPRG